MSAQNDSSPSDDVEQMLVAARSGMQSQLGLLLELYRGYLLAIAADQLAGDLAVKVAPSDLVQETLFNASQAFVGFAGTTEPELRVWLRQILTHKAVDFHRHYREGGKREIAREVSLGDDSQAHADQFGLATDSVTPVEHAAAQEDQRNLTEALQRLGPKYREVIQLRTFDQLSFEEVGTQLGSSDEAARKLWIRAIRQLAEELQCDESASE